MNDMQRAVEHFHMATGGLGTLETPEGRLLRAKLIMEEAVETAAALGFAVDATISKPFFLNERPDIVVRSDEIETFFKAHVRFNEQEFVDGLCDLLYVTMGGAVNMGPTFDIQPHFDLVHERNMAKLAGPKREDGKQLKPEGWTAPDHEPLLIRWRNRLDEWAKMLHNERVWQENLAELRHERLLNREAIDGR